MLIVDDDGNIRCLLRMPLSVGDIEVGGETGDGFRAVPQAIVHERDVLILDCIMPRQRGDKTASALNKLLPGFASLRFAPCGLQARLGRRLARQAGHQPGG